MTTVERLLALATAYARAAVHADRQRRAALTVEGLTEQAVALTHAQQADDAVDRTRATLRADLRHALERPVRATPDADLPVCTWHNGKVEVRAITDDGSRAVRVRYSTAQAVAAGAALIACAAITDQHLGGTLSTILGAFPSNPATVPATDTPERNAEMNGHPPHEGDVEASQVFLDGRRLSAALHAAGPIEPALIEAVNHLNLRIYPRDHQAGDRSAYVVLDMHGVSIGVKRRTGDLYLHADTSETSDQRIAFEINGGGETDHSTH